MKWLPRSLRWRIQLWHGALLLAVLIGFGFTAWRLQAAERYRQLDAALAERISVLSRELERSAPRRPPPPPRGEEAPPPPERRSEEDGPPPGAFRLSPEGEAFFAGTAEEPFYFEVWSRRGELMGKSPHAPGEAHRPAPAETEHTFSRDGRREAVHFTPPGESLVAGVSEAGVRRELEVLARKLAALGGMVLLAGLAGGWWMTGRAIAPVGAIGATAARVAGGQMQARIPVAETASELGQLAAVLNDTFARLEAAFDRQRRFTTDAAHELRTPLAVILAQAQLSLSRSRSGEEYRETLSVIQRSGQRMRGLVESLLQLAVLDAEAEPAVSAPCDLAALAREQIELVSPLAAERGIRLRAELAPAPCAGDGLRLAQIFTNLLSNAVKYCESGDEVLVATSRTNGHVVARVSDNGPGIGPEHFAHLFERFYRADSSRNRATGGAGLGLAICKSIAEAHGGEMEVRRAGMKGVAFTLRLPAGEAVSSEQMRAVSRRDLPAVRNLEGS